MYIIEKIEKYVKPEKPKYGKVIALTAVAVAAVEAAAILGLGIAKKIIVAKAEKQAIEEDFEITMQAGELPVEFEAEAEVEAAE
ncbi:MAG: hypothetical protein IJY39_04630 [Clostridia bacterium]|nr:hypothetical protein [Clostridia bacterium]